MGLRGLAQAGTALFGTFSADPSVPTHFVAGLFVTLIATIFGCVGIWIFFFPNKTAVIDSETQSAQVTFRYPFGAYRRARFDLADISPPEIILQKNWEMLAGGSWVLRLTLPDGRSITTSFSSTSLAVQKRLAEACKAEILAMRRGPMVNRS